MTGSDAGWVARFFLHERICSRVDGALYFRGGKLRVSRLLWLQDMEEVTDKDNRDLYFPDDPDDCATLSVTVTLPND
jgi:hypothetical protein